MPRTPTCAATGWHCWRNCATSSRASRISPACPADESHHAVAGFHRLHTVHGRVEHFVRTDLLHRLPVPLLQGTILDGGLVDPSGVLRAEVVVRTHVHGRRPRKPARGQPRDLHEAL